MPKKKMSDFFKASLNRRSFSRYYNHVEVDNVEHKAESMQTVSEAKINETFISQNQFDTLDSDSNCIWNLGQLQQLLSSLICKECPSQPGVYCVTMFLP